jgi:hypothetical protein
MNWTARQLSSGRRVVEKKQGHWTATINRAPRGPFETTGELLRTSASTLGATKAKASRALRQLAGRR